MAKRQSWMRTQCERTIAEWASGLPVSLIRPEAERLFPKEVALGGFPPGRRPVHLVVVDARPGRLHKIAPSIPLLSVRWASLAYEYGVADQGECVSAVGHLGIFKGASLVVDAMCEGGAATSKTLKAECWEEVLVFSNRFEPEVQELLRADPGAKFRNAYERLQAYERGQINRPWIYPRPDPALDLKFHSITAPLDDRFSRRFPASEVEIQHYGLQGELLGIVTGNLRAGMRMRVLPPFTKADAAALAGRHKEGVEGSDPSGSLEERVLDTILRYFVYDREQDGGDAANP